MTKARNAEGRPLTHPTASPAAAAAMLQAAIARHRAGALDEAAALYARLLAVNPNDANALHLSGVVAHQRGDHAAALSPIRRAIAIDPRQHAFHNAQGVVLLALKRPDEAAKAFQRALQLAPDFAEAHNNLGNALQAKGQPGAACEAYDRAIVIRPAYAEAYSNRSVALRALGRLREAEEAARAAIGHNPRYASAFANLGLILQDQARYEEALACTEAALAMAPDHAEAHCNRAVQLLQLGRFSEGWSEYEWRWQTSGFTTPKREFAEPLWNGAPLGGQTILLHAEQGLGSAIQFVRYVPMVTARGGRVILECQRPLHRLFSHGQAFSGSGGAAAAVIPKGHPLPRCDVQLPLMSLPARMGTTLETIPSKTPYLFADDDAIERWRRRFEHLARPRVGLVWAGNPNHKNDRNRSLPVTALKPLIAGGRGSFISLQVGEAASQTRLLPSRSLVDPTGELDDFFDTAAVIAALDIIISVDTAVAHLAGAMARPVWLLVPFVAEWRWLLNREDSPWYPTMRIFRQPQPGDWDGTVGRVAAQLATWSAPA